MGHNSVCPLGRSCLFLWSAGSRIFEEGGLVVGFIWRLTVRAKVYIIIDQGGRVDLFGREGDKAFGIARNKQRRTPFSGTRISSPMRKLEPPALPQHHG